MKKLLLILLFSSLGCAMAQFYTPFPDSGAVWVNTYTEYVDGPWPFPNPVLVDVDNYCVNGEDTLIGSYTYTKVQICNGSYVGALRDNGGQVFFVPKDSLTEFIAYDFTANIGDTVHNVYIQHAWDQADLHDFVIENIDSMLINGDYRTLMYLDFDGYWIEGIGCYQGLFAEPWPNISMYSVELYCMSHNGEILYPGYSTGVCALDLGMEETNTSAISVFPVPATDWVEIQVPNLTTTPVIKLFNVLGEQITPSTEWTQTGIRVNIADLPDGIYIAYVLYNNQSVVTKVIKE